MRLGLYLMTEKGLAVLRAALGSGIEIAHVTTAQAQGMADNAHVTIAQEAKQAGIPTFTRAHPPDYAGDWSVAAGWRWMLDVPNLLVLHDSLLPRYRGFAPLVTAMVNGDPEVGVTAFLAEGADVYDAGPIVGQRRLPVTYPATMHSVVSRLVPLYGELSREILTFLRERGGVTYVRQDESLATYSVWRDEQDFRIDWTTDDRSVVRLVGAASHPFPGAWTTLDGKQVRVLDAVVETDVRFEQRHPGKVAFVRDDCPIVVCGAGMVRILRSSERVAFRSRLV